jgi:hypothetical protein
MLKPEEIEINQNEVLRLHTKTHILKGFAMKRVGISRGETVYVEIVFDPFSIKERKKRSKKV